MGRRPGFMVSLAILFCSSIVGSTAQSSSPPTSLPTTLASSSTGLIASSSTGSLASSSTGSLATSSTGSLTTSSAASLNSSQVNDDPFNFDSSCGNVEKDLIRKAFQDSLQMTRLATEGWDDFQKDPAFWELFGPKAVTFVDEIRSAYGNIVGHYFRFTAICDLKNATEQCQSKYMYGGIGEDLGATIEDYGATLWFCGQFFTFPTLDYQVQRGIDYSTFNYLYRFDLGYYHANQSRSSVTSQATRRGR
jgi:hypothetical protein